MFYSASAFNQDLAGLGGDVNFVRTDLETGWFHGFTKDFILSVTGSGGYVVGWAGDTVRINDRYFKGGLDFRGVLRALLTQRCCQQTAGLVAPLLRRVVHPEHAQLRARVIRHKANLRFLAVVLYPRQHNANK